MIKAEMVCTLDDMRALARKASGYARFRIPIIISTVAAALLTIFLCFTHTEYKSYMGLTVILTVAGLLFYTSWYVDKPEKAFRRTKSFFGDIPVIYSFDGNVLTISFSSALFCSIEKYKKECFIYCVETVDYFFIWVNRNSVIIIRKNSFIEGTPDELRNSLQKSIGEKYIIKMKKQLQEK